MHLFQKACKAWEEKLIFKCEVYDVIVEELVTFLLKEAQKARIHVMKSGLFGEDILKNIPETSGIVCPYYDKIIIFKIIFPN